MYLLRCFGTPMLERDGAELRPARKKSTALLAYLAVTDTPHSREHLSALLWPDQDGPHSLGYLRTALVDINALCPERLLEANRQTVHLAPANGFQVDVRRFRSLIPDGASRNEAHAEERGRLSEAVALYREGFLHGFTLKDAPAFDDWQRETAGDLARLYREALEMLIRGSVLADDAPGGVSFAQMLFAADRLDERSCRILMTVLALSGKSSAAEAVFVRCRQVLKQDLDAEPAAETTRLRELVRRARGAAPGEALAKDLRETLRADLSLPGSVIVSVSPARRDSGLQVPALAYPCGVFVDSTFRIHIADTLHHRIVRLDDMDGRGAVTIGAEGVGECQFRGPRGLWVDPGSRIYVTDENRIVRFNDMSGAGWSSFGASGPEHRRFNHPGAVCADLRGRIYVADSGNHRVVRIDDMSGAGWSSLGGPEGGDEPGKFSDPSGLFVDPSGWIYVANGGSGAIVRMDDMDGSGWTTLRPMAPRSPSEAPVSLCVDAETSAIYALYHRSFCVVRLPNLAGVNWTRLCGKPGAMRAGQDSADGFSNPRGICLDSRLRIYIADMASQRIVRVDDMKGNGWTEYPPPESAGR